MSFDSRDYDGVTFADEHRIEPDEASELRLSIIERLDARHADIVADLDLLGDAEFHPLPGVRRQYAGYVAEEQALWSALEIVRDLEGGRA